MSLSKQERKHAEKVLGHPIRKVAMSRTPKRDSWITTFNIKVKGARLLWLMGTKGYKSVRPLKYKRGDRVRVTIEKLPVRKGREHK